MAHQLYRHYGEDNTLLYVGISLSALLRLKQHRNGSHWFDEIRRVEIDSYSTREAVKQAEREAVRLLKPKFNIQLTGLYWEVSYHGGNGDRADWIPTCWTLGWRKTTIASTFVHLCQQSSWTFEGDLYSLDGARTWFDSCLTQRFGTRRGAYAAALDKLKPFFHLRRFVDLYLKRHPNSPADSGELLAQITEWEEKAKKIANGGKP